MQKLHMREHNRAGCLITFCGLDGCGKTTMISRAAELLSKAGTPPMLTKQPTDFVRQSKIFRTYMDSPKHDAFDYRSLSLLAASDRVQHCNKVILPELESGRVVLSDRYIYSCIANLCARGYTSDRWIYEIAASIVKPDIAFFIDVPVEIAVERVRSRAKEKNRYIDIDLQFKLREYYLKLARANNGVVVSSLQTEEESFEQIKGEILKCMEARYGYQS